MLRTQNAAVADIDGEDERQSQIAEYERQRQEIRYNQQVKLVRQNTETMLQEQKQSHREEATLAIGYANELTETALKKLNKRSQERQQVAANDERTRHIIIAHKTTCEIKKKSKIHPIEPNQKPKASRSNPRP